MTLARRLLNTVPQPKEFSPVLSQAYYPFIQDTNDLSGKERHGLNTGASFDTRGGVPCIVLSGLSSYVSIPSYSLGLAYAVSTWLYVPSQTTTTNIGAILRTCTEGWTGAGIEVILYSQGTAGFYIRYWWCGYNPPAVLTQTLPYDTWMHVVFMRDSAALMSLYVNNELIGTVTNSITGNNLTSPNIGNYSNNNGNYGANESFRNYRVFDKPLTAEERTALFNESLT